MKPIALIVSVVFLLMSFMPCSDGMNKEDSHEESKSAQHNHQEDEDDACPITCFCSCCGMSVTYQIVKEVQFKQHPKISTLVFFHYQSNYVLDFRASIWQPPQLIG